MEEKKGRSCPECGSEKHLFRGRKKIPAENGQAEARDTKCRCKEMRTSRGPSGPPSTRSRIREVNMTTVHEHFDGKPELRKIYDRLVSLAEKFGPVEQDPKKTSIHLNRKTAFAGVAVRKAHIVLTIKSDQSIASPRIFKFQQTSAKRFHHEIKLTTLKDLDAELRAWLQAAYDLSA